MDSLATQLDELHLANDKTIAKTLESDGENYLPLY
jgi:hypothetical protein